VLFLITSLFGLFKENHKLGFEEKYTNELSVVLITSLVGLF
jgi:hypothetical protein